MLLQVTIARRAKLTELANQHSRHHEGCNISLVFIECIVTDEDVIHQTGLTYTQCQYRPLLCALNATDCCCDLCVYVCCR